MVKLFADTNSDISPEIAKEYGYSLISMPYCVDGKDIYPYVDYKTYDFHAFYDKLREGALPTTSAISEDEYFNYFEPVFKNGDDIFYVHFSRAMSATFTGMDKAVERLKSLYPERKFYEVDTKGITTLSYIITREIGDLFLKGKTVEEVLKWAESEVDKFTLYFFADDLKFFKRSGRVTGLAATMGTLIGIRPIIYMNKDGQMENIGKEKGRNKAIYKLVSYVKELGEDIENHRMIIGHTDAEELAKEVRDILLNEVNEKLNIEIAPVNPTAGSHCGPNGIGICFHAIHR